MLSRRARGEDGLAIVMVALTLVVMLVFVAFAVDVGAGVSERRQDQTSADAAALAAAQLIPQGVTVATQAAINQARENIRQSFTDAAWLSAWRNCTDTSKPPEYTISGTIPDPANPLATITIPCVSFSPSMARVRVRIPGMDVQTSFAQVIGVKKITASAAAEAEADHPSVLPFGLIAAGGSSIENCLKSTANGQNTADPCNGSSSGNFGSIDSPLYGTIQYGTTAKCTGDTNGRLENNMIVGIDHELDRYREPGEPTEASVGDVCFNQFPNTVTGQTGIGSSLDDGMLHGTAPYSGGPARLLRTPFPKRSIAGVNIDDWPLWKYIPYGLSGIPADCTREYLDQHPDKASMRQCLSDYAVSGSSVPLFTADTHNPGDGTYDIEESARFAYVPMFWDSSWGSGSSQPHTIKAFLAVFVQTLSFCHGNTCDSLNPGEGTGAWGTTGDQLDAFTAFVLPDSALPPELVQNGPNSRLRNGRLVK